MFGLQIVMKRGWWRIKGDDGAFGKCSPEKVFTSLRTWPQGGLNFHPLSLPAERWSEWLPSAIPLPWCAVSIWSRFKFVRQSWIRTEYSSPEILFLINYFSYFAVKSKMTNRFFFSLIHRKDLILIYQSWSLEVVEWISGEVEVFTTSTENGRASQHVRQFAFFLQSSVSNAPPDHCYYTTTHLSISFFCFS